jgi:hypothetical protein
MLPPRVYLFLLRKIMLCRVFRFSAKQTKLLDNTRILF